MDIDWRIVTSNLVAVNSPLTWHIIEWVTDQTPGPWEVFGSKWTLRVFDRAYEFAPKEMRVHPTAFIRTETRELPSGWLVLRSLGEPTDKEHQDKHGLLKFIDMNPDLYWPGDDEPT